MFWFRHAFIPSNIHKLAYYISVFTQLFSYSVSWTMGHIIDTSVSYLYLFERCEAAVPVSAFPDTLSKVTHTTSVHLHSETLRMYPPPLNVIALSWNISKRLKSDRPERMHSFVLQLLASDLSALPILMNSHQTDPVCEFSIGSKNELMAVCERIELRTLGRTSLVLNTLLLCDEWMFSWLRSVMHQKRSPVPAASQRSHAHSKIHLSIQTLLCKRSVTHNSSLVSSRSFPHTFTHRLNRIVPAEVKAKFRWH